MKNAITVNHQNAECKLYHIYPYGQINVVFLQKIKQYFVLLWFFFCDMLYFNHIYIYYHRRKREFGLFHNSNTKKKLISLVKISH